jgi:hypothetical protein
MKDRNSQSSEQSPDTRQNDKADNQMASDPQNPGNRLKDGTNDFENGDQEPKSEQSGKNTESPQSH